MSRRTSTTKYYYEVDDVEADRKRYPRSRRTGRGYEDDIEYGRPRISPPIEEMERMRLRDRIPREFVREPFAPPRRRPEPPIPVPVPDPPIRMRRSSEEVMFAEDAFSHPRPRPAPTRAFDEKELIVEERETRSGRRRRPRELEEEIIIDRRERRGSYQRPHAEFDREEEEVIRRRGRVPPFEIRVPESRRRERSFSEVRDELLAQSYGPGRKYRTRDEAMGIVDRSERPCSKHPKPLRSTSLSREDEMIMQWKDRPTPQEESEDEEDMFSPGHRRQSGSKYDQGPPRAWPSDENFEPYFNKFYRERQKEEEQKEILRDKRERRRLSIGSDELKVRRDQRRRSSLKERDSSPDPARESPVVEEIVMRYRQTDHGYDTARPPRAPSPENAASRHSIDETHVRRRSQRRGRRLEENIDFNHLDEEQSTLGGQTAEFINSLETDGRRRAQMPPYLNGERELEGFTRSRGLQYRDSEEDEIDIRETTSTPRSFAEELKLESTDEWSVVQTPSKEEVVEMTGALQIVEVAPKDASSDESEAEAETEVETERGHRVEPEPEPP
ncbi:uncharacterized protein N7483_001052 [Penicillium malachiteum]|uniref:uncharacterized protein n=1 Tax=Penicillium malachiteum TaxID=1324776 RepID=UPI002546F952|nr:uncharacterized protein N7483_001052 [Penicillium malachiteum]KAJ5735927.1 hypothetical protein N7483_001052 [Penicillium malachiteum]